MNINIPEFSLVVFIGVSGSGKSSFGRKHFKPTEVLSSDAFRALVADDENDQSASNDAFDALHFVASKRLAARRLVVIDATNVQQESRKPLLQLARQYHALPVAIVLDMPERLCRARNESRTDRAFGPHVITRQMRDLKASLRNLEREGFRRVFVLKSPEEVEAASIERERLWTDRREVTGPFDIIGDIHGCRDELVGLLDRLGYQVEDHTVTPPEGRTAVFLGDLVDRGPDTPGVLKLVMGMVQAGNAICIPGNHDVKLVKALKGKNVKVAHGLAESLAQLADETPEFREQAAAFLDGLVSHFVLDSGKLVVAHAGMKAEMQGRASGAVREFALYGETTGETDEFGLPVRYNWAAEYRGDSAVVYGHTPIPKPEWINRTINIDTGCVFGGSLTALRYPEMGLVSVPAAQVYAEPIRPFLPETTEALTAQQALDDMLDLADVTGKRIVSTRLMSNITVREENAIAALEVMSRYAVNPKWLIYLPPTMSPVVTSQQPDLLEHPAEAFSYYRSEGIAQVVCEEKHMGSRAVVTVCRDEDAARERFGIGGEGAGVIYTRTGRRFFDDLSLERAFMARIQSALNASGFWEEFNTSWACLDAELMPWSAKAQELLQRQYASVGAAAGASLRETVGALHMASASGVDVSALLPRFEERAAMTAQYVEAYRRYCWPVHSLADLRLAPFHLLATEGAVHTDKDHRWHMDTLAAICRHDEPLLMATPYLIVNVNDADSEAQGTAWWETLTGRGGEGMVVKPMSFITRGKKGITQPAVKVRGREYLRIIYGPEYTAPHNMQRLRDRSVGRKRGLAIREFALGIEALERFVQREPLRRVHECVFGVLASESEPVDPRL
jgi:protein phosphatase